MEAATMRVTQEADYAIRICAVLDALGKKSGASEIAEKAGITQSFALKILRKLSDASIVRSYKGVLGGYVLNVDAKQLRILDVMEAIEGPLKLSKCLACEYDCTKNPDKSCCKMHVAFAALNQTLVTRLERITVGMLNDESISSADITDIIK